MIREKQVSAPSGWLALAILLPLLIVIVGLIVNEARSGASSRWPWRLPRTAFVWAACSS
jgi:hypothetical protein